MAIGFRPRAYKPKTYSSGSITARRYGAAQARSAKRFAVISTRRALGMGATRGFLPLGRRSTGERKLIDVASTFAAPVNVSTTGTFTLLNACIQGSDYTNRIGRKIVCKSLYVKGYVYGEIAATPTIGFVGPQVVRMVLLVDNQPNGATPTTLDLLNTAVPESHLNLNNRDRFRILRDETFCFDPYAYSTTATQSVCYIGNQLKNFSQYVKLNLESIYNAGNAGTIGDLNSGALYMFWIGNKAAGSNTDANAVISSRVRFVDP